MGAADVCEKRLMEFPDVAADVINAGIYGGKETVKSEDLKLIPSSVYTADDKGRMHERRRDIFYQDIKCGVIYAYIGIENQSDCDRIMPIRCIGYDYASYMRQIEDFLEQNRINNNSAYAKVLHENQKLIPVFTIVVYYGREWTGPRTLLDMLDMNGMEEVEPYLMNVKMNLLELGSSQACNDLHGDMKAVAEFLSFKGDRKRKKYAYKSTKVFEHPKEVLAVMSSLNGGRLNPVLKEMVSKKQETEGDVKMRDLFKMSEEIGQKRGEEIGQKRGEALGQVTALKSLMETMKLTKEAAMAALKIPEKDRAKYSAML